VNPEAFRALTARKNYPAFLLSHAGIVIAANPCGSTMLGRAPVRSEDRLHFGAALAESPDTFRAHLRTWASTGIPVSRNLTVRTPDGRRVRFRGEGLAVFDPGPDPQARILLHCVPLQPWDCARLRDESADEPRLVGKMEAMGNLAAGMSHDFNNLLTVMKAEMELALEHTDLPAEITDSLLSTYEAVLRAETLVQGLLSFSRRHHVQTSLTDLGLLLEQGLRKVEAVTAAAGVALQVERSRNALPVLIDPAAMETVLLALVRNAAEASAEGDPLIIRTRAETLCATFVARNAGSKPGEYAVLEVEDHGSGIHPEVQARMLEPFYTTKGRGSGRGLGLAQAFGMVKTLGGYLKVDSEPGRGSTFTVYLPLEASATA